MEFGFKELSVLVLIIGVFTAFMSLPILYVMRKIGRRNDIKEVNNNPIKVEEIKPQVETTNNYSNKEKTQIAELFYENTLRTLDNECELKVLPTVIDNLIENQTFHYNLEKSFYLSSKGEVISATDGKKKSGKIQINYDNENLSVEKYAMKKFSESNYKSIFTEMSVWNVIWYFLYSDLFWLNIPSAHLHSRSDMPADLYTKNEFYINRQQYIRSTSIHLLTMDKEQLLNHFMKKYEYYKEIKCRIINADPKAENYSIKMVHEVLANVDFHQIFPVLLQLIYDNSSFRSGMPDLFVWNPETQECFFAEVKSSKDKISIPQYYWFNKLVSCGFKVKLIHVIPENEKNVA